ncbi:olfactory receptor 6C76-like [Tachyglossus aculeatus]|uniref:olfactory receptor 6C76-like n=1 Tax=Tachyglossus aculeatus TaxID=9261 RepID=UPI0018F3FCD0|nr:olfactory receptor 6C76-like [Tachyglossus aculeatus]
MRNGTGVTEFILVGLFDKPQLQAPLFFILFLTCALSVTGNLTVVTLTLLDSHLRTHMYFFLTRDGLHFFLLAAMSYYRYIVICQPLHYTAVMNRGFSLLLNTRLLELIAFLLALGTLLVTLALVTTSYPAIIHTILRLPSAQQRRKSFSTCSSHMVVISIKYGTCNFMHNKAYSKTARNSKALRKHGTLWPILKCDGVGFRVIL